MSSIHLTAQGVKRRTPNARKIFGNVMVLILLLVFTFAFIAPFVWLILTSLKSPADLNAFPITWLPDHLHLDNFVQALTLIDYWRFAWNSFALSTIQSVLMTATSALVGFGFARLRGWGKRPLFLIMLSTMMLPSIVGIIPTYILFSQFGLVGTYWPWVIWGLASSPFLNFLFRQFFAAIPYELEEAAIVDGCGYGRIFWQIFLPLSKPVIATSMIISFTGVWGDFLGPSLFLDADNTTLAVAISHGYADLHGFTLVNVLAAGCTLYVLPMLILFFFAQKYFVRGIVTSGLKG
ncbi:sugar ABC transporter permease [Dictyobacter alpinus]|uniref:Sugar ABC transporter permease n=1 Tax=Dictyobacter alpinus TaxID=2014873 RepID=A0A402BIT0_9CHLR|nr:carbohydrate ABC transporter permease [Dictyobacter alpinus]GCE31311.1 sugar ABC transporter permease [Dictyobacter alpinus]